MDNFQEEYQRISSMTNAKLIAKELKMKSLEFKEEYNKMKRKARNQLYQANNKDKNNEKRREKYKQEKEENQRPIIAKIPEVNIENVNMDVERAPVKKRDINDLSENTIKSYLAIVKKLYKKYKGKQLLSVDHLYRYLVLMPPSLSLPEIAISVWFVNRPCRQRRMMRFPLMAF